VAKLLEVGADVRRLSARLRKPLRPLWISQSSVIWTNCVAAPEELPFTPLILVSASQPHQYKRMTSRAAEADAPGAADGAGGGAGGGRGRGGGGKRKLAGASRRARRRRSSAGGGGGCSSEDEGGCGACGGGAGTWSYVYVPGAGDDEESWAAGLTPAMFWQHHERLLAAGPLEIRGEVRRLLLRCGGAPPPPTVRACAEWQRERQLRRPAHALAPRGCEAAGAAAAAAPAADDDAAALHWVGSTGIALGDAAAAGSPRLWRSVDAVLCLGERLPPSLVSEWRAAQLLSSCGTAAPPAAVASLLAGSPPAAPIPIAPRRCAACGAGTVCGAGRDGDGSASGSAGSSEFSSSGSPGGLARPGRRRAGGGSFGLLAAMLRRSGAAAQAAPTAPPPAAGADAAPAAAGNANSGGGGGGGSAPIACAAPSATHSVSSGSSTASSYYSTCSEDDSSGSLGSLIGSGATCCTCQGGRGAPPQGPPRILWLPVPPGKKDRTGLRAVLGPALAFVSAHLAAGRSVLLQDDEGGWFPLFGVWGGGRKVERARAVVRFWVCRTAPSRRRVECAPPACSDGRCALCPRPPAPAPQAATRVCALRRRRSSAASPRPTPRPRSRPSSPRRGPRRPPPPPATTRSRAAARCGSRRRRSPASPCASGWRSSCRTTRPAGPPRPCSSRCAGQGGAGRGGAGQGGVGRGGAGRGGATAAAPRPAAAPRARTRTEGPRAPPRRRLTSCRPPLPLPALAASQVLNFFLARAPAPGAARPAPAAAG
jgi:hypothetical protein